MNFHVLNGDALLDRFPLGIEGTRIVARLCLMDDPVASNNLKELIALRSQYINSLDLQDGPNIYIEKTVPELDKLLKVPPKSDIYLWFEEDLFCQVNFWFLCDLILTNLTQPSVRLVLPIPSTRYGFGGLNQEQLAISLQYAMDITADLPDFSNLWKFYKTDQYTGLKNQAANMEQKYPFVGEAVNAHLDRQPDQFGMGKPHRIIKEIIEEAQTTDFGTVFKKFCEMEPIYGYGDLQFRVIYDGVLNTKSKKA